MQGTMVMNTPFEEGSLEFRLVQGIFAYHFQAAERAAKDVYRIFGVIVRPQLQINYKVEEIIAFAEYIRVHGEELKFETIEYMPTYFDFNLQ